MMEQPTFADLDTRTRSADPSGAVSWKRIDGLIPWERLEERIRPLLPQG